MLKKFALATIALSTAVTIPATAMPVTVMAETKNYFNFDFEDTLEQSAAEYESQRETEMPDLEDIEVSDDALADGIEVGGETTNPAADTPNVAAEDTAEPAAEPDTEVQATIADSLTQDVSAKMKITIAGSMTMPDYTDEEQNAEPTTQDINMQINADVKADTNTKNISVYTTVDMDGDEQSMQVYMNMDGDQMITYASEDGESWTKEIEDASDIMSDISSMQDGLDTEIKDMLGEPVQEDLNGVSCNHYSGVLAIGDILSKLSPEINDAETTAEENGIDVDENEVSKVLGMLNGMEIPVEYYEDAEEAKPLKLNIDMSGIDFNDMLSSILGEGYSLEFTELSIGFDFNYDAVDIQIPEAVLTSAEEDASTEDSDAEVTYEYDTEE